MSFEPYLFFRGRCAEAIEFYREALGGEIVMSMRFSENPDGNPPGVPPEFGDRIMHASLKVGDATLMMSDGLSKEPTNFEGFSVSLTARDAAECERWFNALGKGGKVEMPLGKTFFAEMFGGVIDRFGLSWMIIVPSEFEGSPA